MDQFISILRESGDVWYVNLSQIARIEDQRSLEQAAIYIVGIADPVFVRGDEYANLIEMITGGDVDDEDDDADEYDL